MSVLCEHGLGWVKATTRKRKKGYARRFPVKEWTECARYQPTTMRTCTQFKKHIRGPPEPHSRRPSKDSFRWKQSVLLENVPWEIITRNDHSGLYEMHVGEASLVTEQKGKKKPRLWWVWQCVVHVSPKWWKSGTTHETTKLGKYRRQCSQNPTLS